MSNPVMKRFVKDFVDVFNAINQRNKSNEYLRVKVNLMVQKTFEILGATFAAASAAALLAGKFSVMTQVLGLPYFTFSAVFLLDRLLIADKISEVFNGQSEKKWNPLTDLWNKPGIIADYLSGENSFYKHTFLGEPFHRIFEQYSGPIGGFFNPMRNNSAARASAAEAVKN